MEETIRDNRTQIHLYIGSEDIFIFDYTEKEYESQDSYDKRKKVLYPYPKPIFPAEDLHMYIAWKSCPLLPNECWDIIFIWQHFHKHCLKKILDNSPRFGS